MHGRTDIKYVISSRISECAAGHYLADISSIFILSNDRCDAGDVRNHVSCMDHILYENV